MPESGEGLSEQLRFIPWPHGDPGPAILELARELLSREEQRAVLGSLISAEIAVGQARLEGLRNIHGIITGKTAS